MLEIKNLSIINQEKDDEKDILKNVSFFVDKNEIHCILGQNGSGKTTLAYAIMGLTRGNKITGDIFLERRSIKNKPVFERARAGLALAFQEPARFEGLSVFDFLMAGKRSKSREEALKALKLVGLDEGILDRKMDHSLSGGERKRIELASVIIMKPKVMILDEPDASLDIVVYNELYDLLLKVKEELKCSILLITHREEAGLIADKATLIEKGRAIKTGRFREVMREYCGRTGRRDRCLSFKLKA